MHGSRFLTPRFERASGASLEAARRIVAAYFEELFRGAEKRERQMLLFGETKETQLYGTEAGNAVC